MTQNFNLHQQHPTTTTKTTEIYQIVVCKLLTNNIIKLFMEYY